MSKPETVQISVDMLKDLFEEVSAGIANIQNLLISWSGGEAPGDAVDSIFRFFHNTKGTSGTFGLNRVEEIFHEAESLLSVLRNKNLKPDEEMLNLFLEVIDEFQKTAEVVLATGHEPAEKPYRILAGIQDCRKRADAEGEDAKEVKKEFNEKTQKKVDESIRISPHQYEDLIEIVSDFLHIENALMAKLGDDVESSGVRNDINRFSSALQNFVLKLRLSPIGPLLNGLNRVVTKVAQDTGKKVRLVIHGAETNLDRRVIEALRDPLVHMIRNSIDHGVESQDERVNLKKLLEATITLEAIQKSGQVIISVNDDGRGIDHERVKAKALEKGLISQGEASALTTSEALKLIFLPGFSTAEKVTNLSGRGVGMDAVKTAIEGLGGFVEVSSRLGAGTRVTLTLPLSMAIVKSLAFFVGEQRFAVPQTAVNEVIAYSLASSRKQLTTLQDGSRALLFNRQVIPVVSMRRLFKLKEDFSSPVFIIVRQHDRLFALEVDTIIGPWNFVSQPMPGVYAKIDVIGGVHQLNSGEYICLVDLAALSNLIQPSDAHGIGEKDNDSLKTVSDVFRSQQRLIFFFAGRRLALPVQNVRTVIEVPASAIERIGDKLFLLYEDRTYTIIRLNHHFSQGSLRPQEKYTAMIVSRGKYRAAIICEEFYGIHRLPSTFDPSLKVEGIHGAVTHEGEAFLVVHLDKCFELEFVDEFKDKKSRNYQFNVLIAEDDPFFASNLGEFLRGQGCTVDVAINGAIAQEKLSHSVSIANLEGKTYDYVISDYEMPVMNGLQLLEWVRGHQKLSTLPFTLCTAVGDDFTKMQAEKMGVDFYSAKMRYGDILPYLHRRMKEKGIQNFEAIHEQENDPSTSLVNVQGASDSDVSSMRVLTFFIGGKPYAISIDSLREVSDSKVPTPVPGVMDFINHVVDFRGHPIPVLDLRVLACGGLINNQSIDRSKAKQIVVNLPKLQVGLWVDEVVDIRRVQKMARSVGILKKDYGKFIAGLIGGIIWDKSSAYALLDVQRIDVFVKLIQSKTKTLTLFDSGQSFTLESDVPKAA